MKVSVNKRIRALELYLRTDGSFETFKEKWRTLYEGDEHPNRKYMQRLLSKFRQHGHVKDVKRERQRPCRHNDIITDISTFFRINPGTSLRQFIDEENPGISLSTLRLILKNDLGLRAYKCRKFHALHGQTDFNQRYHMSKMVLDRLQNDSSMLSKIIWTDECFIKLNGVRNHRNIYWWTNENPHIYVEKSLNAKGVMVFVGLTAFGPIGPFFFDELRANLNKANKNSVSGESYHDLLETKIMPELQELFSSDILSTFIYQLDGAPGHRTALVTKFLDKAFPNRWWGNRGPMHWAPRSPDLSPLGNDFFHLNLYYH